MAQLRGHLRALGFVLAGGCVFLVKLGGVCSDKNQEVCLENEKGKKISPPFCWQLAVDLNEAKGERRAEAQGKGAQS